jgi:hypothetical protein
MAEISVDMTWQGAEQMVAKLQKLKGNVPLALSRGLYRAGEHIVGEAKERYVPVRRGHLRASGRCSRPSIQGAEVSVRLSFGDAAVRYALVQHENTHFRHRVGTHHYLSTPVYENRNKIVEFIIDDVQAELTKVAGTGGTGAPGA